MYPLRNYCSARQKFMGIQFESLSILQQGNYYSSIQMKSYKSVLEVAEEGFTYDECRFLLGRSGEKQSTVLLSNYTRKYFPKNSSMSKYYDNKILRLPKVFSLKQKSLSKSRKNEPNIIHNKENKQKISLKSNTVSNHDRILSIISSTTEQGVVRKGCTFPKISYLNNRSNF